jgi:hypothetical protein
MGLDDLENLWGLQERLKSLLRILQTSEVLETSEVLPAAADSVENPRGRIFRSSSAPGLSGIFLFQVLLIILDADLR